MEHLTKTIEKMITSIGENKLGKILDEEKDIAKAKITSKPECRKIDIVIVSSGTLDTVFILKIIDKFKSKKSYLLQKEKFQRYF